MSYARFAQFRPSLSRALLLAALPTACAVGVTPEDTGNTSDPVDTAGTSTGGTLATSGSGSVLPKAGTTSTGGGAVTNPFGGTASTGSAGSSSGGQSSAGANGSSHAGSAGASSTAGTSAGGSSGAGAGGSSGAGCACPTTVTWMDNHSIAWKTGDCVDVAGAKYLYVGTIAQTYANGQCNPAKQETWCTDTGNDYKFMLCK